MVDYLAKKVDECLLNRSCWVLFVYKSAHKNCLLYGVAGCPLFRGCLSIEVNGRKVGTFGIVRYIAGVHCWEVSIKRGSTVVWICSWQNNTVPHFGFFSVFTVVLFFSHRWHLRFIRSEFCGQLPQPYSPHRNATWVIPEHMNDMNQEEPTRYVSNQQ